LRYLAYVRASQVNRCGYCVSHNSAAGLRVGVAREKLEALAAWEASPLFSDLERLVLRYAEAMTRDVQVKADLVEALKARLSAEALVQLTLSIAATNFTNRFNEALGTELERPRHRPEPAVTRCADALRLTGCAVTPKIRPTLVYGWSLLTSLIVRGRFPCDT
jgi:AhpD family alkylhydroperoxidase